MAPSMPRRRNLSYREKLAIIEKKESEPSWTQCNLALWAKETFRLESKPTQATISNLLRDKHKLLSASVPLEYRSARRVKHPELDQEMLRWVHQELQGEQSVTRTAIQNKAVELAQELQLPSDVSFSRGWVTSFITRHQLNASKKNGVVAGQDFNRMQQEQAQLVQQGQESQAQVQEEAVEEEEADNSLEVEKEPAEVDQDSREQFSTVETEREDQSRKRKRVEGAWQSREEGRATGELLLDWIAVPGSYSRWWLLKTDEEKEPLCDEINLFLRSHGLRGMSSVDIRQQMTTFVTTFQAAHTWLRQSKVEYPMVADMTLEQEGIKSHVLQMCPHYERLVSVLAAYENYDSSSTSTEAQAATIETTPPPNGSSTLVQAPDTPVAVESPPNPKQSERESTESTATDTAEDETKAQKRRLFELECARLQSEIETRNVQLVLEKTLARKKLQDAGISPEEVDRIFPL